MAEDVIRTIDEACRILEEHPFAGRARDEIRPDLRSMLASPHVIFYRLDEEVAQIVRILDGRRDIETIFSEDSNRD